MKTIKLKDVKFKEVVITEDHVVVRVSVLDDKDAEFYHKTIALKRSDLTAGEKTKLTNVETFIKTLIKQMEGL